MRSVPLGGPRTEQLRLRISTNGRRHWARRGSESKRDGSVSNLQGDETVTTLLEWIEAEQQRLELEAQQMTPKIPGPPMKPQPPGKTAQPQANAFGKQPPPPLQQPQADPQTGKPLVT